MYRTAGGSGVRVNAFDLGRLLRKDEVEVWPENWPAWSLFRRLDTQWRVGMHGPTGLDYNVVLALIDRLKLEPVEADDLLEEVRHLERSALKVIRETAE